MKLLIAVSDITSDPVGAELENIGYSLGVMNMRDVLLLIEPWIAADGQSAMFSITPENAFEMTRLFYALAVINFACFMLEEFSIPSMETGMAQRMKRIHPQAEHEKMMNNYLFQVGRITSQYGLSRYSAGS